MGIYDHYKTDTDTETGAGLTIDLGKDIGKIRIHRAGPRNQRFVTRQQALFKPFQRQLDNDTLPPEKGRELLMRLYAETVLVGWEGITDEEGNPLPFSVDNALKLFNDLPDVYTLVVEESNRRVNFVAKTSQDAEGN